MDFEEKKFKLTSDEFIMKTGTTKSGHIMRIKDLVNGNYKFESWSKNIFKHVFKVSVDKLELF